MGNRIIVGTSLSLRCAMLQRILLIPVMIMLLGGAQCSWGQPQTTGLPDSILKETKTPSLVPDGSYELVGVFEAESKQLNSGTGSIVPDAQASGGKAREARTDKHYAGHLAYGPYISVEPGDYVAFYRIKLLDEAGPDDEIATIDAAASMGMNILQRHLITTEALALNKYVEVPLPFIHPGGKLETRLYWNGVASMRLDNIALYRVKGAKISQIIQQIPRIPQVQPTGFPNNLPYLKAERPYKDVFPVSSTPASTLDFISVANSAPDVQLMMQSLQGIVNREKPVIYLKTCPQDGLWLDWIKQRGFIKSTRTFSDPSQLIKKYRNRIKGVVITDPALASTKNIATMIAGVENVIVVSPRLAKQFDLPVVYDLRGKWKNDGDAYRWAFDNLWSRMNHHLAACLWPDANGVRDYLVQNKVFIFWIPGPIDGAKKTSAPLEQMKLAEEILGRLPANVPIMGYSWAGEDIGIGEGGGVGLMAEFAKYLVGSISTANMSVHSGFKVPPFKQKDHGPAPKLQKDKVYITFVVSDGDNLPVITNSNWPQIWKDKMRGKFPIAWSISPSSCILIPDVMDYYYHTATKNDSFMAAVSGVGYTYPTMYAKRYRESDRQAVLDEFLEQTRHYMKQMDLDTINPSNVGDKEIRRYAEKIPELVAIFPDYGRNVSSYAEATGITARNVPVFHAVTSWDPKGDKDGQVEYIVSQIKGIEPKEKPAFMHVFICNWFWDVPSMKKVLDKLGPDYVAVAPEHLAALCKQDMETRKVIAKLPPMISVIERQGITVNLPIQNVTSKAIKIEISVDKGADGCTVTPSEVDLAPGDEQIVNIIGVPSGDELIISIKGPFGVRKLHSRLRIISKDSLIRPLPEGIDISLVRQFEAEGMPSNTGYITEDSDADGGYLRSAIKDQAKPGHIVFGPYINIEKGKYVAIYRLKKLDDATGEAVALDTTLGGGLKQTSVLSVDAQSLPLDQFCYIPLEFDHPGGSLEMRVFWPGNVSIAVDSISLWKIK